MIEPLGLIKQIAISQPNAAELKAGQEFEAVMLTGFVEQMLPENMDGTDAPRAGADVWRSFMARAMADQLASQNVIGISFLTAQQLMQVREGWPKNA